MYSGFTHTDLSGKCYPMPAASSCTMSSITNAVADFCTAGRYYNCTCTSFSLDDLELSLTYKASSSSSIMRTATWKLTDCYIEESGGTDSGSDSGIAGIFDTVPVQDIVVFCFIFVMFGLGFIGGVQR
jgi:hypothetical protein